MNLILKQFLIIGATFLIILWFQYQDDKKHKRERNSFYEQYKFPLLVSSIIGLVLNLPTLFGTDEKSVETLTELTIITPVEKCDMAKPFVHNNNFGSHGKERMTWFGNNNGKQATDQQIFTDLPDF
jgi:hypothetical protein